MEIAGVEVMSTVMLIILKYVSLSFNIQTFEIKLYCASWFNSFPIMSLIDWSSLPKLTSTTV